MIGQKTTRTAIGGDEIRFNITVRSANEFSARLTPEKFTIWKLPELRTTKLYYLFHRNPVRNSVGAFTNRDPTFMTTTNNRVSVHSKLNNLFFIKHIEISISLQKL